MAEKRGDLPKLSANVGFREKGKAGQDEPNVNPNRPLPYGPVNYGLVEPAILAGQAEGKLLRPAMFRGRCESLSAVLAQWLVSVNTGPVVAGAIGSQNRKDYSVMGDAVNLAARLEDASADGEIYVGPTTYRLTNSLFDFEPLHSLQLKGKAEHLSLYRLVGLKSAPRPTRGIEGLRSDLIGRQGQLQQVQQALQDRRVHP